MCEILHTDGIVSKTRDEEAFTTKIPQGLWQEIKKPIKPICE